MTKEAEYFAAADLHKFTESENLTRIKNSAKLIIDDSGATPYLKGLAQTAFDDAEDAIDAQATAQASAAQAVTDTATKDTMVGVTYVAYSKMVEGVSNAANGKKADITKYECIAVVKGKKPPVGPLPAPTGLKAKTDETTGKGEVILNFKKVPGASGGYLVYTSFEAEKLESYAFKVHAKTLKNLIKGLESGKETWFRVVALGTAGPSPFSQPVSIMVP